MHTLRKKTLIMSIIYFQSNKLVDSNIDSTLLDDYICTEKILLIHIYLFFHILQYIYIYEYCETTAEIP